MADKSTIEWTDATWNPVRGCALVSPGCTNCYAMKVAHRFSGKGEAYDGLTKLTKGGPVWTGEVRTMPDLLGRPLKWKHPRRIFVNSMSDLFHEDVPEEFVDKVFDVMATTQRHTYQLLTKRPERMLKHLIKWRWYHDSIGAILQNVWLGVSVEDQTRADERIPLLLQTPAAVRWISAEPLLGPIDLEMIRVPGTVAGLNSLLSGIKLHWVVVGGESGPGARPMHPDWARALRDQCATARVPFFFKQWGAWGPEWAWASAATVEPASGKTTNPNAYMAPCGLAVQGPDTMFRVGKKASGRILDGRTHDEYPA